MKTSPFVLLLAVPLLGCASSEPTGDGLAPSLDAAAASPDSSWPRFGGPDGTFRVRADDLADSWPAGGPPELWRHPLGPGYSTVIAGNGLLYVTFRDGDADVVQARAPGDGGVAWEARYDSPALEGNAVEFGTGPNASPLYHDGRLFTLSYAGSLRAWDATDGAALWSRDLLADFGGEVLDFGFSASPIVHDGKLIVLVGGARQGAIALRPEDGEVIWRSSPSSVSYATPIVIDVDGQPQLLYFSASELIALDVDTGERLWGWPVENQYRNNATGPQWGASGLLWVATQLDGGTRALRLSRGSDGTNVEEVWASGKMSVHFWNTLRLGDVVFASIGGNGAILAAIDVTDGDILWRQRGFEKVNFLHAGDKTILLDAAGKLALARLSADDIEILAEATIADEPTWTAPSLAGGVLYYRDQSTIRAYDLDRD